MGQITIVFNVLLILLQIILLRKKYKPVQLIQLPVVVIFGFFTDFTLYLVSGLQIPESYPVRLLVCLLSCALLAFGVFLEVKASVTYLAGEGVALALVETFKIEFGKAKIATDSSMVLIGAVCSFLFFHRLKGAREGTIIAALLVGFLVKFYSRHITLIDRLFGTKGSIASNEDLPTGTQPKIVITISREYGSGGHDIGKRVAEILGLSFYDKNLIEMTARDSGYSEEYIKEHEQRLSHTLFQDLYEQNYAYVNEQKPPLDALFLIQSKIIRDICRKESCVIVGRCANFILKEHPCCFNIFIHADLGFKAARIRGYEANKSSSHGSNRIDQEREHYCKHFTGKAWTDVTNYHLSLDSSRFGIEKTARIIASAAQDFENK